MAQRKCTTQTEERPFLFFKRNFEAKIETSLVHAAPQLKSTVLYSLGCRQHGREGTAVVYQKSQ